MYLIEIFEMYEDYLIEYGNPETAYSATVVSVGKELETSVNIARDIVEEALYRFKEEYI